MIEVARLIPPAERLEILQLNSISKAVGVADDFHMHRLMVVWKTYVEPDLNLTCGLCFDRILKNYRELQDIFVQLEKEQRLLNIV